MLYELCTLKKPFEARSLGELVLRISAGKYQPLASADMPALAPAAGPLIAQMLVLEPSKRVLAALILSNPVLGLFAGSPESCAACVAAALKESGEVSGTQACTSTAKVDPKVRPAQKPPSRERRNVTVDDSLALSRDSSLGGLLTGTFDFTVTTEPVVAGHKLTQVLESPVGSPKEATLGRGPPTMGSMDAAALRGVLGGAMEDSNGGTQRVSSDTLPREDRGPPTIGSMDAAALRGMLGGAVEEPSGGTQRISSGTLSRGATRSAAHDTLPMSGDTLLGTQSVPGDKLRSVVRADEPPLLYGDTLPRETLPRDTFPPPMPRNGPTKSTGMEKSSGMDNATAALVADLQAALVTDSPNGPAPESRRALIEENKALIEVGAGSWNKGVPATGSGRGSSLSLGRREDETIVVGEASPAANRPRSGRSRPGSSAEGNTHLKNAARSVLEPKPASRGSQSRNGEHDKSVTWPPASPMQSNQEAFRGFAGRPSTPEAERLKRIEREQLQTIQRSGALTIPFGAGGDAPLAPPPGMLERLQARDLKLKEQREQRKMASGELPQEENLGTRKSISRETRQRDARNSEAPSNSGELRQRESTPQVRANSGDARQGEPRNPEPRASSSDLRQRETRKAEPLKESPLARKGMSPVTQQPFSNSGPASVEIRSKTMTSVHTVPTIHAPPAAHLSATQAPARPGQGGRRSRSAASPGSGRG